MDTSAPIASRPALLDLITVPVPSGVFDTPPDSRHILCFHMGSPVPVSLCEGSRRRAAVRLQGQFCITPAGSSSRWLLTGPARSMLLRLSPSLLVETAAALGLGGGAGELAPLNFLCDPQVVRIGWMMRAEDHDAYPGGRLFVDSLASALAARLLGLQWRKEGGPVKPGRALPPQRLRIVMDYIETHLDEDLTLAELAAIAGYSLSHFKPLFRQAVGTPVHRFVLERRVDRARTLLLEGKKTLVEVAIEAGFSHPSHMARCMRRILGVNPSQVAASLQ